MDPASVDHRRGPNVCQVGFQQRGRDTLYTLALNQTLFVSSTLCRSARLNISDDFLSLVVTLML